MQTDIDLVCEMLWRQESSFIFLTKDQYIAGVKLFEFDIVRSNDGGISGVFLVSGPEFHFAKFNNEPASRDILRKYPGELIEKFGYAQTTTPKTDVRQQRFNERLGFYKYSETDMDIVYRIKKSKVKERICQ
ncbi:MAG: hypothetical protein V4772_08690 [Pseudomonadota bacterium]